MWCVWISETTATSGFVLYNRGAECLLSGTLRVLI